jgi:hypothetical protein
VVMTINPSNAPKIILLGKAKIVSRKGAKEQRRRQAG